MKHTDEMLAKATTIIANFGVPDDEAGELAFEVLRDVLVDVPEPRKAEGGPHLLVSKAMWKESVELAAAQKERIAELEAQLLEKLQQNVALEAEVDERHAKLVAAADKLNALRAALKSLAEKWVAAARAEMEFANGDPAVAMARKMCAADLRDALKASEGAVP
jgi:hypothetical protein